jgi:hypothetical protein
VVGRRKGPSGANAPPVHGIKKCLDLAFDFWISAWRYKIDHFIPPSNIQNSNAKERQV